MRKLVLTALVAVASISAHAGTVATLRLTQGVDVKVTLHDNASGRCRPGWREAYGVRYSGNPTAQPLCWRVLDDDVLLDFGDYDRNGQPDYLPLPKSMFKGAL